MSTSCVPGSDRSSIWVGLRQQVYLGGDAFVERGKALPQTAIEQGTAAQRPNDESMVAHIGVHHATVIRVARGGRPARPR